MKKITGWFGRKIAAFKTVPSRLRESWAVIKSAPIRVRIVLILFALYIVSPLDIIPNFIPFIGVLDDMLVLWLVGRYIYKHLPELAPIWGLPEPKPSKKQRIRQLEDELETTKEELVETVWALHTTQFEADTYKLAFDQLFEQFAESL